jgi:hypothetical protein
LKSFAKTFLGDAPPSFPSPKYATILKYERFR